MVETRQGQGSLALVLQANNEDTSCSARGGACTRTGFLTQIPAIVGDPSILLAGLNSIPVNRLPSVPWLGR